MPGSVQKIDPSNRRLHRVGYFHIKMKGGTLLPIFDYAALSRSGKKVRDSVEAASLESAKASLRAAGLTILDIKPQSVMRKELQLPFLGKPGAKDLAVFCRQFMSILRSGVSVAQVLRMLGQQTENQRLRAAIQEMQADVEKGDTLAGSMSRHPQLFPGMLVSMVEAGEESGNLQESFRQMEIYFDRLKRTRGKVGRMMVYPCVLLVVMVVVLAVMMVKIIPMFLRNFKEMGTELPRLTLGVMAVSDWFVVWWWLLALGIPVLVVLCLLFCKTNRGKHVFGWLALKLPVVRTLTEKSACAILCRSLAVLLGSGLTLTDALELAAGSMTNVYYEEAVHWLRAQIEEGTPLAAALRQERLFPPMVCNLVGVGEETSALEEMMDKVADYYEEEVSEATDKLMNLLEPSIILVMAVFVVFIVLAIFLPMMSMTQAYDQYL